MKNKLYYILLLLFFTIPTLMWGDTVPLEGEWSESDLRSASPVPFIVEKENTTLYIFSSKKVEDVSVRITSSEGSVLYDEIHTLFANETIMIPLNDFPVGSYILEFSHGNGYLSGEFVVQKIT